MNVNCNFNIDNDSGIKTKKVALAGNPNVGKSTVFNSITGMKQHTGNWAGKTVDNAHGECYYNGEKIEIYDLPGTYSLLSHSKEEELARDFICFGGVDVAVVVCDATVLERNLNLVLQIMEMGVDVICCVNLMDEADKKHIKIDIKALEDALGVPCIATSAISKKGINALLNTIVKISANRKIHGRIEYSNQINAAIDKLEPAIAAALKSNKINLNSRWLAIKLLENDVSTIAMVNDFLGKDFLQNKAIVLALGYATDFLKDKSITAEKLKDDIITFIIKKAEHISKKAVKSVVSPYSPRDRKIDKILTGKKTGIPIMLLMLGVIFWITIQGANYPSSLLADALFWLQDRLIELFTYFNAPWWVTQSLILGVYRVLAWVVSVMLPPMAIFFPLFTILEDLGVLPRIAFNLDSGFKRAYTCGKQALTMCMGFGCNAAGVVGCRIIDSPRERLIAIITNNFVPCNGRFPTIILIITMFFVGIDTSFTSSLISTFFLVLTILLGIFTTLLISGILSKTILKGIPSSFTLELPPYRKPQIGKVIIRSIFDRTIFVLGRAVAVAAPAGLIIWIMANITIGNMTILAHCTTFLDPFASLMGLDGIILMAFILGFPANEIVIPIVIMAYLSSGSIADFETVWELKSLLINNGWTITTAICTMVFSVLHWPCSTTLLSIKKETKSLKWTAAAFLIPTITGILLCIIINFASQFINWFLLI